ncbi:MAG: type II toxin-antitoxin system VapC family toxin [Kineosporiaceae bacterium]
MPGEPQRDGHPYGLLDTNILIHRHDLDVSELPDEGAISAITLAELSAGLHMVSGRPGEHAERARRLDILQRTENEFDPIPFDADAARAYGRLSAALLEIGRTPRRRIADLMIAATAMVEDLPVFTTNPGDYVGLGDYIHVVPVRRPAT